MKKWQYGERILMSKTFSIYRIHCKISNKNYIGQTSLMDWTKRVNCHFFKSYNKCPALKAAIKKYGFESFDYFLIEKAKNQKEADQKERFWIKAFCSLSPYGYNLKDGGQFGGGVYTEESRLKLKGRTPWNKGKKMPERTEHHRMILSANAKRLNLDENFIVSREKQKRKIMCLSTNTIYSSVSDLSREIRTSTSNICKHLNGKISHVKGRKLKYLEDSDV